MVQTVRDVMTAEPMTVDANATAGEAARIMRDNDVGDVIVRTDGVMRGIVTDRDLVVRAMADGRNPAEVRVGDICSPDLTSVSPMATVEEAARTMRENAIRRLPVVEDGQPVGVVTLGDLAVERDPDSALADISVAPPNT